MRKKQKKSSSKSTTNLATGKHPYILINGLYEIAIGKKKGVEFFTVRQVFEINNLINAKKYIDLEIENIKKQK